MPKPNIELELIAHRARPRRVALIQARAHLKIDLMKSK